MKLFRLPRLRRRTSAPTVPAPEYPIEATERPGRSLDELLVPYSRRTDVVAGGGDDAPAAYEAGPPEPSALAEDRFDAFADGLVDEHGDFEDAVADEDFELAVDAGDVEDVEDAEDWDDDASYPFGALDEDGAWGKPIEAVEEPAAAEPADAEPILYAVPAPEPVVDARVDAPLGGWNGLEEAVRLAALEHGELLAEAGRRAIEGRRAMDRDELIAALLVDGGADLAA